MRTKTTPQWTSLFDAAGVPCCPVQFIQELFDDPQVLANDYVVEVDHTTLGPIKMGGAPFAFDRTPLDINRGPPGLSEHADELLAELGYPEDEMRSMRDRKIIVEVGVAWGGALLFYSTLMSCLGGDRILGVDTFIPADLRDRLNAFGELLM